jgi:hypothetical protein
VSRDVLPLGLGLAGVAGEFLTEYHLRLLVRDGNGDPLAFDLSLEPFGDGFAVDGERLIGVFDGLRVELAATDGTRLLVAEEAFRAYVVVL